MPSSQYLAKLSRYIPLWQRNIPPYRVYQPGDPQIRVFLPLFWMKLVKPHRKQPPGTVMFEVHHQMTRNDITQYLEKIYNVPVVSVRTQQLFSEKTEQLEDLERPWQRERKVAYVQVKDETFEYPKMFGQKGEDELDSATDDMLTELAKHKEKKKMEKKLHHAKEKIPPWFR